MSTQQASGYVIPSWSLGDHFRKARLQVEMGQKEFAESLGVPAGSLAAWETDRSRPRDLVAIAKRIEMLTHIPAAWILGLEVQTGPGDGGPGRSRTDDLRGVSAAL